MSADVLDLHFEIAGRAVPEDHADLLYRRLRGHLPWLDDEPAAGILPLRHVSPGSAGEAYLSRHSRLILRLPRARQAAAAALCGARLDLGGEIVVVGAAKARELSPASVLYSPFVTIGETDEAAFVAACRRLLTELDIAVALLCGKPRHGAGADHAWSGYSLMLHGLSEDESLRVQRAGLGGERKRGCGIFVPHKSVAPVGGRIN